MKKIFLLLSLFAALMPAYSQTGVLKPLRETIKLLMPRTADDEMPGTRGACVVWHPLQKKYYAAMAGNTGYPLGVYDIKGLRLSEDNINCEQDVRGLWYNPVKKQLQGNSFDDNGWFNYILNAKGIPIESNIFMEGMNQPDPQSVGAFIPPLQEVLFLNKGSVSFYTLKDANSDKALKIYWGHTKADGPAEAEMDAEAGTPDDYNNTTVIYTGIKGAELGFLNITEMQVELYNMTDGFLVRKLKFPEDAPMNTSFNFAYTNGMYWLFNIETRTWTGYK